MIMRERFWRRILLHQHHFFLFFLFLFVTSPSNKQNNRVAEAATVSVEWSGVDSPYFNDPSEEDGGVCQYANADSPILLGHPMSIDVVDKHYVLGITMLKAAQMTIDRINMFPRCGLTLRDGLNYSIALQTYGDESSKPKTARIAEKLAQDPAVEFMLAGYSSSLTSFVTPYAQNHSKLCLTGGSSRTSVHADKPYVFGLNPPSRAYLENAFVGTAAHGATTVAYLSEDTASACDGVTEMATKYNMTVLNATIIPEEASLETYEQVAHNMKTIYNPDLMITCVRTRSSFWNLAMRQVDWVPKAQVYTYVVGTNEFENLLGPTDLPYTMGVSSWDSAIPPIPDDASGWTPRQFDVLFEEATLGRPASYQQVQQSAVISVLVQAIERVGWFKGADVVNQIRQELATGFFPTVYGNVSFDSNGQNAVPFLLLQYDSNSTLHVLLPEDKHFTDFDLYYPLPTWSERDCLFESTCLATGGDCTTNGTCSDCTSPLLSEGIGSTATCVVPPEQQIIIVKEGSTKTTMLAIVIPLVLLILVGAILFVYWQKLKQNNDKIWKVDVKELIFAEPTPEIIGRGSFGLVLKAEFRGTAVAVKRALPPPSSDPVVNHSNNNKTNAYYGRRSSSDAGGSNSIRKRESNNNSTAGSSSIFYDAGHHPQEATTDDLLDIPTARDSSSSSQGGGGSGTPGMRKSIGLDSGAIFSHHHHHNNNNNNNNTPPPVSEKVSESKLREQFIKEMRVLSRLRHPCITTVMGAVISSKVEPMLIMEYMDHGSLQDILHNETLFVENEMLLSILMDIASGCRFLHAANPQVIHCDLKAGNILVDSRFRAKVSDFGLSQKKHNHATGTPFWMAPELLRKESLNTTESDVYSFGILLYEVLSRKDPYHDEPDDDETVMSILRQIADPVINKRPPVPPGSPPQLGSMMCDCIVAKPEDRPSFEELHKRIQRIDVRQMEESTNNSATKSRTTVSLFDIFPRHVAEALRDGKEVEPEHKENVTIFFSDIVGFTTISQELDPRKVARMLDRFYLKLDNLSQIHDVFKVETIGDAYMAVSNLVKDQNVDHASRIAQFSVDAIEAANETLIDEEDPDKGYLHIRCGFHSGSVVADVVGSRNPRYCLFGDTVNTASRMESNSIKNRIHCSKSAVKQLKKENCLLPISSRGVIKVKGKGEMETFWINLKPEEIGEEAWVRPRRESALNLELPALEEALDESKTENGELSFSLPSLTFSNPPSGELSHHSKTVRRMSGLSLRGILQDSKRPEESLVNEHWHDEDTPAPTPVTKFLNQKRKTWLRLNEEVVQLDDELSV